MGSDLSPKERLFCVISYVPKATVQAAMGAVPLAMVLDGRMISMTVESGEVILAIAVLSIVVTAPLGAIGIKLAGPRLLRQE
jgi:NhaP-type Na+/H+ or K+/H+ antiporter